MAVTSVKRTPLLPDVPTVIESGLPGFEASTYFGLFAPPGTPRGIVQRLHKEVVVALQNPKVKARFASQGAEPVGSRLEALAALIKSEIVTWNRVVDAGQIKLD
jgi:tripartite-type tricarboxylate transporter receptor subunit TctC